MRTKYLTLLGAAFALVLTSKAVVAQEKPKDGAKPASEIELSEEGKKILCEKFPQNSRCPGGQSLTGGTTPEAAPADGSSPSGAETSPTSPTQQDSSTTTPGSNSTDETSPATGTEATPAPGGMSPDGSSPGGMSPTPTSPSGGSTGQ